ncbi:MAG: hypothetical protein LUG85_08340, partial [Clostridiales bacterium]|nr:hypothetical protein [Clostridiales bacterium]
YEEWKQKFVDIDDESDIIKADVTISSRSSGKGNANAILHFDVDLNNRQQKLLDSLPEFDSKVVVKKSDVKLSDLSALTAKTGDEFAMFTKQGKRLIVRGNNTMVNITAEKAAELAQAGYHWSGHTHPGTDVLCLIPSDGDKKILAAFGQSTSVIYNSKGDNSTFGEE